MLYELRELQNTYLEAVDDLATHTSLPSHDSFLFHGQEVLLSRASQSGLPNLSSFPDVFSSLSDCSRSEFAMSHLSLRGKSRSTAQKYVLHALRYLQRLTLHDYLVRLKNAKVSSHAVMSMEIFGTTIQRFKELQCNKTDGVIFASTPSTTESGYSVQESNEAESCILILTIDRKPLLAHYRFGMGLLIAFPTRTP